MRKKKLSKSKLLKEADICWRNQVRALYHNKCAICGLTEHLNAHHIISRSVKELRHDIRNGILLCSGHHLFNRIISAHKGSLLFISWLIENHREQYDYLIRRLNEIHIRLP